MRLKAKACLIHITAHQVLLRKEATSAASNFSAFRRLASPQENATAFVMNSSAILTSATSNTGSTSARGSPTLASALRLRLCDEDEAQAGGGKRLCHYCIFICVVGTELKGLPRKGKY